MLLRITLTVCLAACLHAQSRQVAITFDDLPRGGDNPNARDFDSIRQMTAKLLQGLQGVPVAAFANPGRAGSLSADQLDEILRMWVRAGAELGNHTDTHPGLNNTPLHEYTQNILAAEPAIARARGGTAPRYFRHPFLQTGKTRDDLLGLRAFLREHQYTEAPVTLDNSDWLFAAVYARASQGDRARIQETYIAYLDSIFAFFEQRAIEVVGRPIPQILLLHANQLNADTMPALLEMMKRRGYEFVPLETALKDAAYSLPESFVGTRGISWLHRWAHTRGIPQKWEPDEPAWIRDAPR